MSSHGTTLPAHTPVLIAGAGPTGLVLALSLARLGIECVVIDREADILRHPRAIGLDNDAFRALQFAGIGDEDFEWIAIPRLEMHSPYCGELLRANMAGHINLYPLLAMFYQPELEEALNGAARAHPLIHLVREAELTGFAEHTGHIAVEMSTAHGPDRIDCHYLVGADGANSTVRRLAGLEFTGRSYADDWLIVDVIGRDEARDGPRIDHTMFYCRTDAPYPHMPAPGGRERWEFKLKPSDNPDHFLQDETIRALLRDWYPRGDALIERKAIYKFQARTAPTFRQGRVLLLGDAAHVMPPFAGQGMVSGLRDGANLAWKLAYVLQGKARTAILDSYTDERRPHVIAITRLARFIGMLVTPKSALHGRVLHNAVKLIQMLPVYQARFGGAKIKPTNFFKRGLFVRPGKSHALTPGHHLPQILVRHADGRRLKSDEIAPGKLKLIGFGCDPAEHLGDEARARLAAMGGVVMQICHGGQLFHRPDDDLCWEDETGALIAQQVTAGRCVLVRPDHCIVTEGPVEDADRLVDEAFGLLAPTGTPEAFLQSAEKRSAA